MFFFSLSVHQLSTVSVGGGARAALQPRGVNVVGFGLEHKISGRPGWVMACGAGGQLVEYLVANRLPTDLWPQLCRGPTFLREQYRKRAGERKGVLKV